MSCRSLSMEHGITDSAESVGVIRQKLLHRSNEIYMIADYSKFDKTSFLHICDFDDLTGIVTDKEFSSEWVEFLHEKNVKIIDCSSK